MVFDTLIDAEDYKKAKIIRLGIDEGTRKLIASNEQLAQRGINIVDDVSKQQLEASRGVEEAVGRMSDDVVYAVQGLSDQLDRQHEALEALNWALVDISKALRSMGGVLKDVLESVKDTEKAWAYAQYEKCLENYKRGLHKEAIERILYAINGFGSAHIGEKEDFRFQFLLGSLYLGENLDKPDQSLIDPRKAENAFLLALRYAEYSHKEQAAKFCLHAGISAYRYGAMDRALQHISRAIELDKTLAEAYFQQAKVLAHMGRPFAGPLQAVIEHDPGYALKAADDIDIKKYKKILDEKIQNASMKLRDKSIEIQKQVEFHQKKATDCYSRLQMISVSDVASRILQEATDISSRGNVHMESGTLEGHWLACQTYSGGLKKFKEVTSAFTNTMLHESERMNLEKKVKDSVDAEESAHLEKRERILRSIPYFVVAAVGLVVIGMIWLERSDGSILYLIVPSLFFLFNVWVISNDPNDADFGKGFSLFTCVSVAVLSWFPATFSAPINSFSLTALFVALIGASIPVGLLVKYIFELLIPKLKMRYNFQRKQQNKQLQKDIDVLTELHELVRNS